MLRYSLTIFVTLVFISHCYAQPKDSTSIIFNDILLILENKITNTKPGNKYVIRSFNFTLEKIRKGEVSVIFDDTLNYGITGCASANILEDGSINIVYGSFVLDAYEVFPVLIEGIIVHEFQHVYDFLTKPELIEISRTNPIEKTYFEVDALTIEGIYFNTYRTESDEITPLERFFVGDAESGFWSLTAVFERADIQLLHQIDEVEKNVKSKDKAIQNYISIGREILDKIEFSDNNWNNYCNLVSLRTFSYYSKQVLFDILFATERKELTADELELSNFPKVDSIVSESLSLIDQYKDFFSNYRTGIINSFNEDVVSRIK